MPRLAVDFMVEMILQALEYEDEQGKDLDEFFRSTAELKVEKYFTEQKVKKVENKNRTIDEGLKIDGKKRWNSNGVGVGAGKRTCLEISVKNIVNEAVFQISPFPSHFEVFTGRLFTIATELVNEAVSRKLVFHMMLLLSGSRCRKTAIQVRFVVANALPADRSSPRIDF
ncbi:hypothetical protein TSUD_137720 [Trifolium subterraneum]|uniref:Uncharacterized protein n=1 Tax=Trifolium subterraneum TaxID=3900 RepID=A0A2Z6PRM3_TRISU|nr:hypothetical protein TSUD_137720 [Trifolium subterraneum]